MEAKLSEVPLTYRSKAYQFKLVEIPYDLSLFELDWSESTGGVLLQNQDSEEVMDLNNKLATRVIELVERLTKRQRDIIRAYYFEGLTQVEIAKALSINQSTVTHSLNGIPSKKGHYIGGSIKRLRIIIETDPQAQELLAAIRELKEQ